MINVDEAYEILNKEHGLAKVVSCLDFGSFYAFTLAPPDHDKNERYMTGPYMDSVDKNTGKTFVYDITTDVDAYYNATPMEVKTIWNTKVSELGGGFE